MTPSRSADHAPSKTRSACNRCHAQKLKCARRTGQQNCDRCLRLSVACRFAARAPRVSRISPGGSEDETASDPIAQVVTISPLDAQPSAITAGSVESAWTFSSNIDAGITETPISHAMIVCRIDADQGIVFHVANVLIPFRSPTQDHFLRTNWSGDDYNSVSESLSYHIDDYTLFSNSFNGTASNGTVGPTSITPSGAQSQIEERGAGHPERHFQKSNAARLASLSISLYECASNLPPQARAKDRINGGTHASRRETIFAIDELFRLTNEFTNIVESLLANTPSICDEQLAPGHLLSGQPIATEQILQDEPPVIFDTSTRPALSVNSDIDDATMSMVLSCHCRLTETYTCLFDMMRVCMGVDVASARNLRARTDSSWAIVLPELQVGCIAAAPALRVDINSPVASGATSSMYMALITMISSKVWERLSIVLSQCDNLPAVGHTSDLVATILAAMSSRTNVVLQRVNVINQLL